jgi:hypothetical protein
MAIVCEASLDTSSRASSAEEPIGSFADANAQASVKSGTAIARRNSRLIVLI